MMNLCKTFSTLNLIGARLPTVSSQKALHLSCKQCKSKASKIPGSKFLNKPLTYDEAWKCYHISSTKNFLSFNTASLHEEDGGSDRIYEDHFIRNFIIGTFYRMISKNIVIKRRFNMIDIILLFTYDDKNSTRPYFFVGYSERLLSAFLKCNVKVHLIKVSQSDVEYKFI